MATDNVPVVVQLEPAGGDEGDASRPCTYTYDIYWFPRCRGDQPLARAVRPLYGRDEPGWYIQAKPRSHGLAMYNGDDWQLLWAFDEHPAVCACG